MRTTVTIDDDLLAQAAEYSGLTEPAAIIRFALRDYIAGEAARRLAKMGGSMPDFEPGPRKRYFVAEDE